MTSRRSVLRIAALAGIGGLAGCSDLDDSATFLTGADTEEPTTHYEEEAVLGDPVDGWSQAGSDMFGTNSTSKPGPTEWPTPVWGVRDEREQVEPKGLIVTEAGVFRPHRQGVVAYDLDGEERWEVRRQDSEPPTVFGETIFVPHNGGLTAYSIDEGELRWMFRPDGDPSSEGDSRENEVPASVTVVDGTVYLPGETAPLHAVDAVTGDHLWTYDFEDWPTGRTKPIIHDDTVFIATRSTLHAVSAGDGAEEWTTTLDSDRIESVCFDEERSLLYAYVREAVSEGHSGIHAVDPTDGTEVWQHTPEEGRIATRPALDDGYLYFGTEDTLYALEISREDVTEHWQTDIRGELWKYITVADGTVYAPVVHDSAGHEQPFSEVLSIDAQTGDRGESAWLGGGPLGQPVIYDGRLYVDWNNGFGVCETGDGPSDDHLGSWDGHRGGSQNTGFADTTGITEPEVKWLSASGSVRDPILHDGMVCVSNGGVDALDPETGARFWRFPAPRLGDSVLATDGDRIMATGLDPSEPIAFAIDPETGDREWSHELMDEPRAGPVLGEEGAIVTDESGSFYAIDPSTGEERSRAEHVSNVGRIGVVDRSMFTTLQSPGRIRRYGTRGDWISSETMIGRDTPGRGPVINTEIDEDYSYEVYYAQNDGGVHAVAALVRNPVELWAFQPSSPSNVGDPITDGERVYAPYADGMVYALGREEGNLLWETSLPEENSGSLAITSDTLYVAIRDRLLAFDPETGDRRWELTLDGEDEFGQSPPDDVIARGIAVGDDAVFVTSQQGTFKIGEQ